MSSCSQVRGEGSERLANASGHGCSDADTVLVPHGEERAELKSKQIADISAKKWFSSCYGWPLSYR